MPTLFSKRHYEWLALFARHNLDVHTTLTLASDLHINNPAFKRDKFLAAAGVRAVSDKLVPFHYEKE